MIVIIDCFNILIKCLQRLLAQDEIDCRKVARQATLIVSMSQLVNYLTSATIEQEIVKRSGTSGHIDRLDGSTTSQCRRTRKDKQRKSGDR